jgi:hypothetical protein
MHDYHTLTPASDESVAVGVHLTLTGSPTTFSSRHSSATHPLPSTTCSRVTTMYCGVPLKSIVIRPRPEALWFDRDCGEMKRDTRRLERLYREQRTVTTYECWRDQFDKQRVLFQTRYTVYWTSTITECRRDSKALWSKVNVLLRPPAASIMSSHSADDFASYFVRKV